MENTIQEVKEKNDLVEVIGSYIPLKKAGKHFQALCPFHQEKSPSFVVSPERQMWYCFGACHEGGDVLSFVMKYENISFYEALQELARRANIQLKDVKFQDREWEKREILYKINTIAASYFKHILHNTKYGEKAREYIEGRKLNEKIVQTFELGYAPDSWESLLKFLQKKGFQKEDIARTGLLVKSERGSFYDRFRGRLMFPIKDSRDNIIGFSGRILTSGKEAKYINTPETEIYHKRESLYGINITKEDIKKENSVIVVEGEFDVIGPYQQGVSNIVAIKGSAVTKDHLRILKRFSPRITLCLDADAAGQDAIMKTIKEAEEMEIEVYVAILPQGKDPDEAVRNNPAQFKEAIKKAVSAYDFLLFSIKSKHNLEDPFEKKKAVDELAPFLFLIKNPILFSHYVKQSAEQVQVDEESLREVITMYEKKLKRNVPVSSPKEEKKGAGLEDQMREKYLLSYLFQSPDPMDVSTIIFNILKPEDFESPALGKIAHYILEFSKNKIPFDVTKFVNTLPAELHPVFDDLYLNARSSDKAINENPMTRALEIKMKILKAQLKKMNDTEESSDKDKVVSELMTQLRNVSLQLEKREGLR